jgi:hypothetical protein
MYLKKTKWTVLCSLKDPKFYVALRRLNCIQQVPQAIRHILPVKEFPWNNGVWLEAGITILHFRLSLLANKNNKTD